MAADLDTLLADPARRPPEGWSVRAEAWAHDRDTASWREVAEARRLRRDLALYPHQARTAGKETPCR